MSLRVFHLADNSDIRGSSFSVPASAWEFLGSVQDMHIADIRPGTVRGNHYHRNRRYVLCIRYIDRWALHWDSGAETQVQTQNFSGSGLVLVEIEPMLSHAVRNDGSSVIQMIGIYNTVYDPKKPDSHLRRVV